ncbi:non-ribosomal peptide synthetase/type I polyketide synthase [Nannocystis sp. SCPEA4]|uniref:non-ribosomal peptide synthetase/type I polyketide synthase n=1 Tax=Nannocystis sp. SCPEA4 TaxID=2996787 RepID=UPI002271AAF5|nr:non-ribosomal peptide synthetase/type I polyketide synthase [Nannocystis sp. SCPEA4]MCY1059147.1 amino acid adenylation domain-containing protein [Nannocystis sp. SCPEA4]
MKSGQPLDDLRASHESVAFWLSTLAGAPPRLDLPGECAHSAEDAATAIDHSLGDEDSAAVRALAASLDAAPAAIVLAGLWIVLARHTGQSDVVILARCHGGAPPAPARGRIEPDVAFTAVVRAAQGMIRSGAAHPASADDIIAAAEGQELAFPIAFWVVGDDDDAPRPGTGEARRVDVVFSANVGTANMSLHASWRPATHDAAALAGVLARWHVLLRAAAATPGQPATALPLLSASERRRVVAAGNDTAIDLATDVCVHALVEAEAARSPDRVAVIAEGGQWTYAELNRRADAVAGALRRRGAGPGALVAICADRSLELVAGLLGILKAGAAYVPLDPEYPRERLARMLADSGARLLLAQRQHLAALPAEAALVLDECVHAVDLAPGTAPARVSPDDLMYVLYTSGSTGRPKGVMNVHRGVVNRLLAMQRVIPLAAGEPVLQKTPYGFDVSVYEFFWPLVTGATLVMARPGGHRDPAYLVEAIHQYAITTIHFVPPMLAAFLEQFDLSPCHSLRRVLCSGEALPPAVARACHARLDVELYNFYGPTEAAIDVTVHRCEPGENVRSVPIGAPLPNCTIYLLDRHGEPVPPGSPGELHIGGVQVSRGYWGRPDLTAESFVPDPFTTVPGQRLYRTGDLARRRADGLIEFLGRIDHQVKIRGFRVEPGEIEAALREHEGVRAAVVVVAEHHGDRRLVAYVVFADSPQSIADRVASLRADLTARLPAYMVPAAIVPLAAIPVNANGKIDRKALPAPDKRQFARSSASVAPRTSIEARIAAIWADVLGLGECGVSDDFLDLGGHSLHAAQILARLRRALGTEVSLAEFFAHPTIAGLAAQIEHRGLDSETDAIPRASGQPSPVLSFAEERLYFLHQLAPASTAYHCPLAFHVTGDFNEDHLEAALRALAQRHEILRTRFVSVAGVPQRVIDPEPRFVLERLDLGDTPPENRETALQRVLAAAAARPFDLAAGPVRAGLVRLGPRERVLWLVLHHIATDGWTEALLLRELGHAYAAARDGVVPPASPPPLSYADYAAWQRSSWSTDSRAAALERWRTRLSGAPTLLALPADRPRTDAPALRGARLRFTASPAGLAPLRRLARSAGAPLSMALLAIFAAVLRRFSDQDDLVVGLTSAARIRLELEDIAGFFVDTLPIRLDLADDPGLPTLLARVRDAVLAAHQDEAVPFEQIVQAIGAPRGAGGSPLVQVAFAPQPGGDAGLQLPDCDVRPLDLHAGGAIFDLTLLTRETADGGLDAAFEYASDLFDRWRIEALSRAFAAVLAAVDTSPTSLTTLPLLSPDEQSQQYADACGPLRAVALDGGVHAFVEAQVDRTPQGVALVADDEVLSYEDLERRANRLAQHLCALGVGAGSLVGVVATRTPTTFVAVLAILKAGGAYVPLDPSYPAQRLAYIVEDAALRWIFADPTAAVELPPHAAILVAPESSHHASAERPRVNVGADDLAYVLYTSGSTGRPKGVAMGHGALRNLVQWHLDDPRLGRPARTLQFASLNFDVSAQEFLTTWAAGGTLVLVSEETRRDAPALWHLIERQAIARLFVPFVFLQHLAEAAATLARVPTTLVDVVTAGEQLKISPAIRGCFARLPACTLHNHYGPTEAHVVTAHVLSGPVEAWPNLPPIGHAIANTRIYVLDARQRPVPPGVTGELYIAGVALARGYLGRPELTGERFVADPWSPGARMYRTGDLARRTNDGTLEYVGRADAQVKLRGVRVELGEIEAVLAEDPAIAGAAAIVREDVPGDRRLVAYVTARASAPLDIPALRTRLRARLPEVMLPAAFVELPGLPLLPSGKLDRRALPLPVRERAVNADHNQSPRTALEQTIANIWCEVLRVDHVGLDDRFFDLGGHSLLLAQVRAGLARALGRELGIVDLFRHPTVRSLAAHLDGRRDDAAPHTPAPRALTPIDANARAIAIVGMAGRFPNAASVDALWQAIAAGRELVSFFTREQLAAAGVDPALVKAPRFVPAIGVMPDAMCFDAAFFGYSPREARLLDPQQRVLLEVAWAALEHAGHPPRGIDEPVGVFAGCDVPRYWLERIGNAGGPLSLEEYEVGFGNMNDTLATRVAYELGLRGPAFTVQTACSTSLVAVHVACQSILAGECTVALAGGAVVLPPDRLGHVSEGGTVVSQDGRCRPFDADAQGIVAGSGVAVVVLKRLADALADGDTIHAVIRATAINNDGARKVGLTAPSVSGQCEVIERALALADVDPGAIGLVEAHGTATRLGDPIEVAALTQAWRRSTARRGYCALGSIKGNIGHLGATAGVTGLIKAALALAREAIPPTLHFRAANPELALADSPFFVAAELMPWPKGHVPRFAAVSSFGVGGTNAHAILEEAPELPPSGPSRPVQLLVLSARSPGSLTNGAMQLSDALDRPDAPPLADVAHTLARGRTALPRRMAVIARDAAGAVRSLRATDRTFVVEGVAGERPPRVAFLFPGGGTQEFGMGRESYEHDPQYRAEFDAAAARFAGELEFDVRALLYAGDPEAAARELRRPTRFLPAIFCCEYALARRMMALGVVPAALTGHSLGEYTAAAIAGILSLDDAVRLLATRARLHESLDVEAALLAVALPADELAPRLGDDLDLAVVNAADSCVVAGRVDAIARMEAELARAGVDYKRLPVAGASHCALVEPLLPRLVACAQQLQLSAPAIPVVSNVTGDWLGADEARDPLHWARHLRGTVRFAAGLDRLLADPELVLVEVGPGRTLAGLARRHPAARGRLILTTMATRGGRRTDLEEFTHALAQLWCRGTDIRWRELFAGEQRRRVPLPTYAFERVHHELPRRGGPALAVPTLSVASPSVESPAPSSADPVARTIADVFADVLGVPPPAGDDNFFDLGGSSFLALRVRVRLEELLAVKLPVHAFVEHPTPAGLATAVRARLPASEPSDATPPARASLAVTLRPGPGRRLFLVQPIGGTVFTYLPLAQRLPPALHVTGLRASGMEPGEPVYARMDELVTRYLAEVRAVQPSGPYLLGGHSAGGAIAFEMARRLIADGERVDLVALLDTSALDLARRLVVTGDDDVFRIAEQMRADSSRAYEQFAATLRADPAFRALVRATWQALAGCKPAPLQVDALYVKARVQADPDDRHADRAWMDLVDGAFTRAGVDADHFSMMDEPAVATTAAILAGAIPRL